MVKSRNRGKWVMLAHEQIYLKHRGHMIDLLVYPVCQRLWDEGIETFFSCQGGPTSVRLTDGKIFAPRAYVSVREKDAKKVCKMLKGLNPVIDIHPKRDHTRVAVRFDPCYAAKNVTPAMMSLR